VGYSWICAVHMYSWWCSGLFFWVVGCMKGWASAQTLSVYRLVRLSILSSVIRGFVCVRGGLFFMILMIFFCVLISGCRFVLLVSSDPQMLMPPIR